MYLVLRKTTLMLLLAVVCFKCIEQTTAACCTGSGRNNQCKDCSIGTPCCGYRRCNIFCCACECRRGNCQGRKRRSVIDTTDASAYFKFKGIDMNKNGIMEQIEFSKALEKMKVTDNETLFYHWTIMDENNDGIISLEEFDHEKL